MQESFKNITLFDLNGTLTNVSDVWFNSLPQISFSSIKFQIVQLNVIETLKILKKQTDLGLICGYDLPKIQISFKESIQISRKLYLYD